jgi:hypothetical protein
MPGLVCAVRGAAETSLIVHLWLCSRCIAAQVSQNKTIRKHCAHATGYYCALGTVLRILLLSGALAPTSLRKIPGTGHRTIRASPLSLGGSRSVGELYHVLLFEARTRATVTRTIRYARYLCLARSVPVQKTPRRDRLQRQVRYASMLSYPAPELQGTWYKQLWKHEMKDIASQMSGHTRSSAKPEALTR